MGYCLPERYSFCRQFFNRGRWHIKDMWTNGSGLSALPLCSVSGIFRFNVAEVALARHICPVCLKIAKESGIIPQR